MVTHLSTNLTVHGSWTRNPRTSDSASSRRHCALYKLNLLTYLLSQALHPNQYTTKPVLVFFLDAKPVTIIISSSLSSRRPTWSSMPSSDWSAHEAWEEDWAKQEIPNQFLITDPTSCQPGFDLKRSDWTILNRYRTGHGICAASLHVWGIRDNPLCTCDSKHTIHMLLLSTNVHWRNALVGFRRFTLQVKIPSLGFAHSAYARRRMLQ